MNTWIAGFVFAVIIVGFGYFIIQRRKQDVSPPPGGEGPGSVVSPEVKKQ